jgi:Flp pilus assembly protein CpaB
MRRVGAVFIVLGVVFALFAGIALFTLFPRQTQPVLEPTVQIVVAFQSIPAGTVVESGQVGLASWPQHIPVPIGSFSNPDDVVQKIAAESIPVGVPVVSSMLYARGPVGDTHNPAPFILDPGTVAVAIPVNTNSNVAEAVRAGDRVDVIVSFSITSTASAGNTQGGETKVTQHLLQDVLVLQVGTWPRPSAAPQPQPASPINTGTGTTTQVSAQTQSNPAPVVVTLEVTEQDAQVLKYMEWNAADFSLALRPVNDHVLANPTPVTLDYLQQRFHFKQSDLGR